MQRDEGLIAARFEPAAVVSFLRLHIELQMECLRNCHALTVDLGGKTITLECAHSAEWTVCATVDWLGMVISNGARRTRSRSFITGLRQVRRGTSVSCPDAWKALHSVLERRLYPFMGRTILAEMGAVTTNQAGTVSPHPMRPLPERLTSMSLAPQNPSPRHTDGSKTKQSTRAHNNSCSIVSLP